ncbi:MAG TPA: hypothetical protein VFT12_14285, partial [Thermoanaerobaculia bacterium]|nr:hypothetical protein [Thermoanaerobaculia bacterium]
AYEWRDAANAIAGTSPSLTAGAGTYTVTVTDASCGSVTSAPVTVQTTCKAVPVVTWTDPADIVYGTPLSGTQLNASANVPGTFTYNPPAGTILDAGPAQILSVDFTPADSANYENVNGTTVRINVLPATPVVTWSNPANIVYGTPLSGTQLNATASVPGTFVYSPPAGTILSAGPNQVLSVDFQPDSANYTAVNGTTVRITVERAPTTTTITSVSPSPSMQGEPVTVSFAVGGIIGTGSGTVTVTDGIDSCSAPLGAQSCVLTLSSAGGVTLTATYSGDANHRPSVSAGRPHFVDQPFAGAVVSGSTLVCAGGEAAIRADLPGSGPWTITWSDGLTETVTSTPHIRFVRPASTTTYTIQSLTSPSGSTAVSGSATITVNTVAPPAIIEVTPVELGGSATFRATPGYTSYQWFRNGTPIAGATSSVFTIASVTSADLGSYSVTGTRDGCTSAASVPYTLVPLALPIDDAIIPVVGRTHGAFGSLFRTAVTLTNATTDEMQGEIAFIDPTVPAVAYLLAPGETRYIDDLLPPSFTGLTSANVLRQRGPLPSTVVHVFNDDGDEGTSGLIERIVPAEEALRAGDVAVLLMPIDPATTRFNLGIRTLSTGVTLVMTHRRADGSEVQRIERTVPASTLVHEHLAGSSSDSLTFEIISGSAVIYGSATDNGTNDPNLQIASRSSSQGTPSHLLFPVAGSVPGAFGSQFSTGVQIHNPSSEPLAISVAFRGSSLREMTIAPFVTVGFDDIVSELGATGMGGLDITSPAGIRPVIVTRIYSISDDGEASATIDAVPTAEVLSSGEEAVVVAPHQPSISRFNIGLRALAEGMRVMAVIRDRSGVIRHTTTLALAPDSFRQDGASVLLGYEFSGDESVVFRVLDGSGLIYGVWTDNTTHDPAVQYAV